VEESTEALTDALGSLGVEESTEALPKRQTRKSWCKQNIMVHVVRMKKEKRMSYCGTKVFSVVVMDTSIRETATSLRM